MNRRDRNLRSVSEVNTAHLATGRDRSQSRGLILLVAFGVFAPACVALVALVRKPWWPSSDLAVEYLRMTDVGTRHTPLVGTYSRFGFNHPGPALYFWSAPFVRLAGPRGMFLASGVLLLISAVGVLLLAKRRAGFGGILLGALTVLLLLHVTGIGDALGAWNPYIGIFPLLLAVFCAWSVCEGELWCAPVLVATTSFCVQSHVGFAAVSLVLLAAPVVVFICRHRRAVLRRMRTNIWMGVTSFGVALLFWSLPAIEQLRGHPGNLMLLYRSFAHPTSASLPLSTSAGFLAALYSPTGTWLTGSGIGTDFVPHAPVSILFGVCFVTLATGFVAFRRNNASFLTLASIVVALNISSIWAISRIQGPVSRYLIAWAAVVAVSTICSCLVSLHAIFGPIVRDRLNTITRVRFIGALGGVLAVLVAGGLLLPTAWATTAPQADMGLTSKKLADLSAPYLVKGRQYELAWHELRFVNMQWGYVAGLERHDRHPVFTQTKMTLIMAGSGRILWNPRDSAGILGVHPLVKPPDEYVPQPGEKVIVRYNRATKQEFAHYQVMNAEYDRAETRSQAAIAAWKRDHQDQGSDAAAIEALSKSDPTFQADTLLLEHLRPKLNDYGTMLSHKSVVITLSPPA